MEAQELRIGNHLLHKHFGRVILEKEDFVNWNFEDVRPIPLNRSVLIRFGFDEQLWQSIQLPNSVGGSKNILVVYSGVAFFKQESFQGLTNKQLLEAMQTMSTDVDRVSFLQRNNQVIITDRLLFVHQLQNLYYALCGEELTTKQEADPNA